MNIENVKQKKAVEVIGIICAVCFMLALWIEGYLYGIDIIIGWVKFSIKLEHILIYTCNILMFAGFILITIGVVKKKPVVVLSGLLINIFKEIWVIRNQSMWRMRRFMPGDYGSGRNLTIDMNLLAIVILAFISLAISVPKTRKIASSAKYICFLSSTLLAVSVIYSTVSMFNGNSNVGMKISDQYECIYALNNSLSFIFLSLWLYFTCSSTAPKKAVEKAQNNDAVSVNSLELLTSYKELLDQGAITQEEFDAKKKELLKF